MIFMFCYAISIYGLGQMGDRVNLKYFIGIGMACTCVLYGSLAFVRLVFDCKNVYVYAVLKGLDGFSQGTVWPGIVGVMSNWYGKGNRGLLMGLWSGNSNVSSLPRFSSQGGLLALFCVPTRLSAALLTSSSGREGNFPNSERLLRRSPGSTGCLACFLLQLPFLLLRAQAGQKQCMSVFLRSPLDFWQRSERERVPNKTNFPPRSLAHLNSTQIGDVIGFQVIGEITITLDILPGIPWVDCVLVATVFNIVMAVSILLFLKPYPKQLGIDVD